MVAASDIRLLPVYRDANLSRIEDNNGLVRQFEEDRDSSATKELLEHQLVHTQ
jgi:hypothetical protein